MECLRIPTHGRPPGSKPGDNVDLALEQAIVSAEHPAELIDLLCVADLGCWTNVAMVKYPAAWDYPNDAILRAEIQGRMGPVYLNGQGHD